MSLRLFPILIRFLFPLIILLLGLGGWWWLKKPPENAETTPSLNRQRGSAGLSGPSGLAVELRPLELTSYQVFIPSRGESSPSESTPLVAEQEGEVRALSKDFEVGTFVSKGHVLVEFDQQDLRSDLAISESRVAQSEASLAQEQARATQAALNWNDMGYLDAPGELVLRKPQLKQAAAALKAAKAQLAQAERRLERAHLRVPYDAVITQKAVSRGQRLGQGALIGEIVATAEAQIRLPVAMSHEAFLPAHLPGQKVILTHPVRQDLALQWEGRVVAREPVIDPETKQLHLMVKIQDPYSLKDPQKAPLPMGHPVEARITGKELQNVYVVPKTALRGPNLIHITGPDLQLLFLEIDPVWTDEEQIIFRADLKPGTKWVATIIRRASEGQLLAPLAQ